MIERRSQTRLLDSELVLVGWQENGKELKQLGNVEDLSGNGLAVVVDQAPPVGASLTISYGENTLRGIVRYTKDRECDALIGIEFNEDSRNSALHFQPEMLLPQR